MKCGHSLTWAGYAACLWALVFAAMSVYWALGGAMGLDTLSPTIQALASERDPEFVANMWITGVLKIGGGMLALVLIRPLGEWLPRRLVLVMAWGGTAILLVHGGDFLVRGVLWGSGVLAVPESVDSMVVRGYTFLWGPWWLVGGGLFGTAALDYTRRTREPSVDTVEGVHEDANE